MIWHVQQNVVKCLMIPLPRFSCIYCLIHFNTWFKMLYCIFFCYICWNVFPTFSICVEQNTSRRLLLYICHLYEYYKRALIPVLLLIYLVSTIKLTFFNRATNKVTLVWICFSFGHFAVWLSTLLYCFQQRIACYHQRNLIIQCYS